MAQLEHKMEPGHGRWRAMLDQHLDGDLAQAQRMQLFEHLETCDECRRVLEAEERLIDRLSRLPRLAAPSDLRAAIVREAARERAEALQPIVEDERYASLFRTGAADDAELISHKAGVLGKGEGANARIETAAGRLGIGRQLGGRRGLLASWRRASPRLATGFLTIAAAVAFTNGNFNGVPQLQRMQAAFRGSLGSTGQLLAAVFGGTRRGASETGAGEAVQVPLVAMPSPAVDDASKAENAGNGGAGRDLRAGAGGALARIEKPMQRSSLSVDPTRASVRSGREFPQGAAVPLPAERLPVLSNQIVLQVKDGGSADGAGGGAAGSLQVADAVQKALEERLCGRVTKFQQAERDGRVLRVYTALVSARGLSLLQEALSNAGHAGALSVEQTKDWPAELVQDSAPEAVVYESSPGRVVSALGECQSADQGGADETRVEIVIVGAR